MKPITLLALLFTFFALPKLFSQTLYQTESIQTIELQFEQTNWDALLNQYHYEGNGQRLLATAVINGIVFDSVGVRYKGNSSYNINFPKKSLNIKLDYILDQNYEGITTLKLNNGFKDPSQIREVLSYWILRHFMEAPQANYARIYINDEYRGLYTNVESINKGFVERRFYSDRNNTFFEADLSSGIVQPPNCPPSSGASLNYLGEDTACYQAQYLMKSDLGWPDLIDLCFSTDVEQTLAPDYMEIDRFLWMSVFNNLTVNLDSYLGSSTHNYYLFQRDNGKFVPIIWDLNECFGTFRQLSQAPPLSIEQMQTLSPDANKDLPNKPLLDLLLNQERFRKMYYAHYRAMLQHFFQNGTYLAKAEELQNLINQAVQGDNYALYPYNTFQNNLYQSVSINGPGGNPIIIPGIEEIMEERITFLQNLPNWQVTAPEFITTYNSLPNNVGPGEEVWISTSLQAADSVWLLYRYSPTQEFSTIAMYDDGNHQDGTAGDGTFGINLNMGNTGLQFAFYAENEEAGTFLPYNATYGYFQLNTTNDIVINELMASNTSTQADQDGEYDDWVELYNNTNQLINLGGYYLSDNEANLQKWTFPNGTQIEAQGYLVVWLDKDETQQGLHANFKLSADGEALFLSAPDGTLLDGVEFGPQSSDFSYARCPNGSGSFGILSPTFWSNNEPACLTSSTTTTQSVFTPKFYPNPTNGELFWEIPPNTKLPLQARLCNLQGQTIQTFFITNQQGRLTLKKCPPGLYLLYLSNRLQPLKIVYSP